MKRTIALFCDCAGVLLLSMLCTGAAPRDPIGDLHFLIGKWSCTYAMASQRGAYTAAYTPALGGAGLLQTDVWKGGGGDAGIYSYDPSNRRVNLTIVEGNGQTTIFFGKPAGAGRIVYRTAYPDASASEIFQRVTASEYTLSFRQRQQGKTITSKDVCVR